MTYAICRHAVCRIRYWSDPAEDRRRRTPVAFVALDISMVRPTALALMSQHRCGVVVQPELGVAAGYNERSNSIAGELPRPAAGDAVAEL